MLPARLSVNSRLLAVNYGGARSDTWISYLQGAAQGSTVVPFWFKGGKRVGEYELCDMFHLQHRGNIPRNREMIM